MRAFLPISLLLAGIATPAPAPQGAVAVRQKLDLLRSGHATPGSTITFTSHELNAYARWALPAYLPHGVREPRLELGNGSATATAMVDFLQVRQGAGQTTNWFLSKLIEGEHPVRVSASIRSSRGRATVYLNRVEISGVAVSGSTLDFLIDNFFHPLFPEAKINQPFELEDHVERIDVRPDAARAVVKAPAPALARSAGHPR